MAKYGLYKSSLSTIGRGNCHIIDTKSCRPIYPHGPVTYCSDYTPINDIACIIIDDMIDIVRAITENHGFYMDGLLLNESETMRYDYTYYLGDCFEIIYRIEFIKIIIQFNENYIKVYCSSVNKYHNIIMYEDYTFDIFKRSINDLFNILNKR